MEVYQYKDFISFHYYWEYFGICAIVRAIDEDFDIGILFCFLLCYREYFKIYANTRSFYLHHFRDNLGILCHYSRQHDLDDLDPSLFSRVATRDLFRDEQLELARFTEWPHCFVRR